MRMSIKRYLGDAVYADFDGYYITLTTDCGDGATNEIHLEPKVLEALRKYADWLDGLPDGTKIEGGEVVLPEVEA